MDRHTKISAVTQTPAACLGGTASVPSDRVPARTGSRRRRRKPPPSSSRVALPIAARPFAVVAVIGLLVPCSAAARAGSQIPTGLASGRVLVNGFLFREGTVRYGSHIDVTRGKLQLTTRAGTIRVWGSGSRATFVLVKALEAGKPLDVLRLVGGNFSICDASSARTVRSLWANGHGRFRTRGRYSYATGTATSWLTDDRCDGTLTDVKSGTVEVFDTARNARVVVGAGARYVAIPGSASSATPPPPAPAGQDDPPTVTAVERTTGVVGAQVLLRISYHDAECDVRVILWHGGAASSFLYIRRVQWGDCDDGDGFTYYPRTCTSAGSWVESIELRDSAGNQSAPYRYVLSCE
jgi:hypothetical protein